MPFRDILVTGVIFALLPICFLRPWVGILVWTWIGIMNPHRLTWGFAWDMPFAQLVAVAILGGLLLARDRKPIAWTPEFRLLLVLFGYMTFTTFFAWAPEDAWVGWDKIAKILLMTYITTMLIYGKQRIYWLVLVATLSIGFYGFKSGLFSIFTGGQFHVRGPEKSFLSGNNFLGLALVMGLPLLLVLAQQEARAWLRRLLYVTFALTFIAIPFTYSRGAMLGLAVMSLLLFMRWRNKVLLVILLIPMVFAGLAFAPEKVFERAQSIQDYEQDDSAMQRIAAWDLAWNIAVDRPLRGGGFNFEGDPARWHTYLDPKYYDVMKGAHVAHSIYFQVLGQHGFVGFGLFMIILFLTYQRLGQLKKQTVGVPDLQWISEYAWALRAALIGYAVTGAFLNLAYFDLYYLIVALTAMLWREVSADERIVNQRPIAAFAGKGRHHGAYSSPHLSKTASSEKEQRGHVSEKRHGGGL
ncbi:wzy family polymerase, exosortase system type 1 associated [Nitrosococcus halophilus Nc 4]|uniref:Wzy family polymerase, exosortase system type 1 associated n=1 Tax=Nitrosococcus halophilus (strain Nc4) TaxID=472759 RepID=D5C542_NITHN|nr:putative O-glycosylation ligase, exosortase A system-associated [Nitrosococcus halophilus]ADE15265.1 wzy family polymerase, exosortase system type 1 associated [Nitrosococcus halophilus Nc 4]